MRYKSCEEYVLGAMSMLEDRVDELEEENKKLQVAVRYAEEVLGIIKQVMFVGKRDVKTESGGEEKGCWVIGTKTGPLRLRLDNEEEKRIFVLLADAIGEEGAVEKAKELRAAIEAKKQAEEEKR